jgi:hypothetical protein
MEDLRWVFAGFNTLYKVEQPETLFEKSIQLSLSQARRHHLHEEFALALRAYRDLQAMILRIVDPKLPINVGRLMVWSAPFSAELMDSLIKKTVDAIISSASDNPILPPEMMGPVDPPPEVRKLMEPFIALGVRTAVVEKVSPHVFYAYEAVERKEWDEAISHFELGLKAVPAETPSTTGYLLRDIALLKERSGNLDGAEASMKEAGASFKKAKDIEGEFLAISGLGGIKERRGQVDEAKKLAKQATKLAQLHGIHRMHIRSSTILSNLRGLEPLGRVVTELPSTPPAFRTPIRTSPPVTPTTPAIRPGTSSSGQPDTFVTDTPLTAGGIVDSEVAYAMMPELMSKEYLGTLKDSKMLSILGGDGTIHKVDLDDTGASKLTNFYHQMSTTSDLAVLLGQAMPLATFVAYIPYIYFFVLPMSIGDCLVEIGNFAEAEENYRNSLNYPYLNRNVETVKVWTRLAELYLEWGDMIYRNARNNTDGYNAARAKYELIIGTDNTIPTASPLYSSSHFTNLRSRAGAIAAASDVQALNENPAIITPILKARGMLHQIEAGLNFFGFTADYVPPFSFEYMQNTARYFAQHASSVERTYIQFKAQAENEELRREQMDQQADIARASVELERRGVEEAQAGVNIAQAGLNYATVQHQNALDAQSSFAAVRWELLELSALEAWSSAAAVDEDDEVQQKISGYNYYNTGYKNRSDVLQDLAYRRTRITHDLEAARLAREVASAAAYRDVAQAQLDQANARVSVAVQRVQIARMQQRFAEENRDFLDMKEFNARLWYELSRYLRRLSQRYLDMAIEIAAIMERAYLAETGRDLNKIQFNYSHTSLNDLMGADFLMRDIDYFTLDYITTTRTKKAPLKISLSLADSYPMAFSQLQNTGRTYFETHLEQFDRMYPGLYLQKLQNVELVLIGLTGPGAIHGTLRNIGVSTFRDQSGSIRQQIYPSDVMPLSEYEIRSDALIFRTDPNTLRLFENNGIATMWQIDLPLDANDFDLTKILDVHLVLYIDAFHDTTLENSIKSSLPATGSASRGTSLRFFFPDELFYLRNKGEAQIHFTAEQFPNNQTSKMRTSIQLRLIGNSGLVDGLVMRLTSSAIGTTLSVTADSEGIVTGSALGGLTGQPVIDEWQLHILPGDNPGKVDSQGELDLSSLEDVQIFQEYTFTYRS